MTDGFFRSRQPVRIAQSFAGTISASSFLRSLTDHDMLWSVLFGVFIIIGDDVKPLVQPFTGGFKSHDENGKAGKFHQKPDGNGYCCKCSHTQILSTGGSRIQDPGSAGQLAPLSGLACSPRSVRIADNNFHVAIPFPCVLTARCLAIAWVTTL